MDLRLPGTNGTDTLIAIRGEFPPGFPQARIIMLTSSDTDGEIQRALRAGASGYVLKSMPQDELLVVIRSVHAANDMYRLMWQLVSPTSRRGRFDDPGAGSPKADSGWLQEQTDRRQIVYLGEHGQLSHQKSGG